MNLEDKGISYESGAGQRLGMGRTAPDTKQQPILAPAATWAVALRPPDTLQIRPAAVAIWKLIGEFQRGRCTRVSAPLSADASAAGEARPAPRFRPIA